ncbi:cerebellar degeneration-related protein 2 isoform X2 [Planococcus citri]|uniref:cerebellar degeneration-related protein 2 isoform X2 n=1 Tax=Planococcus citri TaxID=170843 RepID=UPI0031F72458
MSSYEELCVEWCDLETERWSASDLQLAAELGKTLLERNKELESALKQHQNIIEDQSQEIEYLTKQTAALKEVNSSRFRIYEQLEISIQDLEHDNVTLSQQSAADKKQIKSLLETIQSLENKCDELQQQLDKKTLELENEKRQRNTANHANEPTAAATDDNKDAIYDNFHNQPTDVCTNCSEILTRLQEAKASNVKEQRTIDDLKDQLSVVLQDNDYLRNQVDDMRSKEDEMKSVQDELATLEQIRLGNLCKRCLRSAVATEDFSSADELSSVLMTNDDDEDEILANIRSAVADFSLDKSDNGENPYRQLVEKYEALCKMQEQQNHQRPRSKVPSKPGSGSTIPTAGISLQDELRAIGGYYDGGISRPALRAIETDSECEEEPIIKPKTTTPAPPTSISSGSISPKTTSDGDLLTKSTQTEVLVGSLPGSFLCRISDGNDCQFSIYDDASPIESRFRKTPEYRHLFREIFAVLKRAAEAKDEGETLPLLDDRLPASAAAAALAHQVADNHPKVPPVTPAREDVPFIPPLSSSSPLLPPAPVQEQDEQQIINDLKTEPKSAAPKEAEQDKNAMAATTTTATSDEKCDPAEDPNNAAVPAPRDIMEQLAAGVKLRDSKRDRRVNAVHHHASPSPSPCSSRSASKRRAGSKARRKRERLTDSPSRSRERHQQKSNRPVDSELLNMPDVVVQRPHHKERPVSMFGFCGGSSSASKEVAKLKILEKSYAEVLRMGMTRKKSTSVSKIHQV